MSRGGFLQALIRAERAAQRNQAAQVRAQARVIREAQRAKAMQQRALASAEKEHARLYTQQRIKEVEEQNDDLARVIHGLETILAVALVRDPKVDLEALKEKLHVQAFQGGALEVPLHRPSESTYQPAVLTMIQKVIPGRRARYEREREAGHERYVGDLAAYEERERNRLRLLEAERARHLAANEKEKSRVEAQHAEVDAFKQALSVGSVSAVVNYFELALNRSLYPEDFPRKLRVAYVSESKQLVVEIDLPTFDIVPEVGAYRYVKSKDEVIEVPRALKERRAIYSLLISQITLRTLHELFLADPNGIVSTVVLNGFVDSIDKATGQPARPCVVTVRTSRDVFGSLDLRRVEPAACLRALNASVSKNPEELAPVRPVLDFNMVDPRFIEEADVLSQLDNRPNLMDLTPSEFENLITNLFAKMGLETRLTRASRDGGVDCVAYDPRPILGGKVVIQAKRYKHTVGVSAVRDLFGTLQNEGASKGILVATSGYGKASFEFAEGKPIELLSGSNLLYLLAEHAGIEARIDVPDDWKDPSQDTAE